MAKRRRNPTADVFIYAAGTTLGIVVGTVVATWIVESMRASGSLPGAGSPQPLPVPNPTIIPPPGYVAGTGREVG